MPLTDKGLQTALFGGSTDGALARLGTKLKLYTSASTPNVNGSGFTEVANGNGYTTGGKALIVSNFTYSFANPVGKIQIADQTWNATGDIANIAGAYLTNAADEVLAWWVKTPFTAVNGDPVIADDLSIELTLT